MKQLLEKNDFYEVNKYGDNLLPGDRIKIEHSLRYRDDGTRLAALTPMPADKLAALREDSAAREKAIFAKLVDAVKEWEEQAAGTMLLEKAIEYVKTPPVKHTANEWQVTDYGFECSNMVYKMTYKITAETKFNPTTKTHDDAGWMVDWSVSYNFPPHAHGGGHIAGQDKKRFTDKEKLDNYVIGRITAHAQYFVEISPPVPKNLAWKFSRNGQLLPGYTVEGQAPPAPKLEVAASAREAEPDNTIDYSKFIRKKPKKGSRSAKGGDTR